jgi:hypothetical protein
MLGTATTASDYKRPLDTLRMAINGNRAAWARQLAQSGTKSASIMPRISATLMSALQLCWWTLSVSAATIYGTAYSGPTSPATHYTIDSTTGAATPVGAPPESALPARQPSVLSHQQHAADWSQAQPELLIDRCWYRGSASPKEMRRWR